MIYKNCKVDGVPVTSNEVKQAISLLFKNRKSYKNTTDVSLAFEAVIRQIRGGKTSA